MNKTDLINWIITEEKPMTCTKCVVEEVEFEVDGVEYIISTNIIDTINEFDDNTIFENVTLLSHQVPLTDNSIII